MSDTPTDPRVELLARARLEQFQADRQQAAALYIPPGVLPHVALATIRAHVYRTMFRDDINAARIIVALDRVIEEMAACDISTVYERHGEGR
jgi:hypothetical protein